MELHVLLLIRGLIIEETASNRDHHIVGWLQKRNHYENDLTSVRETM